MILANFRRPCRLPFCLVFRLPSTCSLQSEAQGVTTSSSNFTQCSSKLGLAVRRRVNSQRRNGAGSSCSVRKGSVSRGVAESRGLLSLEE